ncbi:MAG: DUF2283 domain-containing protein [Candidatus Latescibacteria bacterium]|nr:DUF2283 domain-containing protein [Candidatus Latescibacterota bacterium]
MIVLDTHVWIWLADNSDRLADHHRRIIRERQSETIGISVISCWEVAKLVEYGRLKLIFKYDRAADILYINKRPPYSEQESEELEDEVIVRINPETGEVENLEVLFFSTRLLRDDLLELPILADMRLAEQSR